MPQFKYRASGTYVIASQGTGTGAAGYQVTVTPRESWVGSLVFKQNIAPPGSTPNYVSVAYQDADTAEEVAAGTAITATAALIISPTVGDLVVVYTHTSGEIVLNVNPATTGVTNSELRTAFLAAGYETAGQNTPDAMLSVAVADMLGTQLNVKAFGAMGDGVTDDTAAIQAALDAASAAGGGVVYAPPSTYSFYRLSIPANVTLCGAGMGATLFERSSLGPNNEEANLRLMGIRLAGNYAGFHHASVKGIWDPADPTTQTYDLNVAVVGDDVMHTTMHEVETYNAHIGYVVGGVIGTAANYSGQSYSRVSRCYAHDTYDLGFGFVAVGTADADTCIGNALVDCWQEDSYATAGCEVRYQRAAQIIGFNARNNANTSLGAAVRLEETSFAQVIGLQASSCHMGVQIINDTTNCTVVGATTRRCFRGIDIRQSANILIDDVFLSQSSADGIRLFYSDGTAWTSNNENIHIRGGKIVESGYSTAGYGVYVVGTGYTEAASANNGLGLVVDGVDISDTVEGHGIYVRAGGNWSILNCTFTDNAGFTSDGHGIVMDPPSPNGVPDTTKPAGGWIDNCRFIKSAAQPNSIGAWSGAQAAKPSIGTVQLIGGPNPPNYSHTASEAGGIVGRGVQRAVRTVVFADTPVTLLTRDYLCRGNAVGGAITVNLPPAASHPGGVYVIKKIDSTGNAVTIDGDSAETIDGAATVALATQYHSRTIQSDGANWNVIAVNP